MTESTVSSCRSSTAMSPSSYAALLLASTGCTWPVLADDQRPAQALWRDSGAMWLSGEPGALPLACTAPVATAMQGAWLALCTLSPGALDPGFDAHALLGERAAIAGLQRRGRVSAGGSAHLMAARDGWIALNLARTDDLDLVPAWLEAPVDTLDQIREQVATRSAHALVQRGRSMGMAVASMPSQLPARGSVAWHQRQRCAPAVKPPERAPLVLDLSALWAGPLCAKLLQQCGARVIRVESVRRPDGARRGPAAFYQLLNGGKESVALALDNDEGRSLLKSLLEQADMVIEGSRPRALEQMGINAAHWVASGRGRVWVSITAYGRAAPGCDWVGFGDDVGVAAGLSNALCGGPNFCADAVADPLAGIHAAVAALDSWQCGGGELLDVSLFGVAGHVASLSDEDIPVRPTLAATPRARSPDAMASTLGQHNAPVLQEFGLSDALGGVGVR